MQRKKKTLIDDHAEKACFDEYQTTRASERNQEDKDFFPVILKRTDEAVRHPDDILERAIEEGLEQHARPAVSLLLSGLPQEKWTLLLG